jgi:hypothetical protein
MAAAGLAPPGLGFRRPLVADIRGRSYRPHQILVPVAGASPQPVPSLLALTPELQLLESGAVSYATGIAGFQCLLEPSRLRVADARGQGALSLLPPRSLVSEVTRQLEAQVPLLEKARADHQRWLDWVGWASVIGPGREALAELRQLDGIRQAVDTARTAWQPAAQPSTFEPRSAWVTLFPGAYLDPGDFVQVGRVGGRWVLVLVGSAYPEPPVLVHPVPRLVLVEPDGHVRREVPVPPESLTPRDRFLYRLLERRLVSGRDESLRPAVQRWREQHPALLQADLPAGAVPRSP